MTWKEFFQSPTAIFGWLGGLGVAAALIPGIPDWLRVTLALLGAVGLAGVGHNAVDTKDIKDSSMKPESK